MLPSGNDSAHALAEFFGGHLKQEAIKLEERLEREREQSEKKGEQKDDNSNLPTNEKSSSSDGIPENFHGTQIRKSPYVAKTTHFRHHNEVMFFLEEMNKTAERLELKQSFYDSPHGLSNINNKTSALDIAKLTAQCMKIPKFREVVGTKFFQVKKNTNGNRKTYKWHNTHLMLGQRGINGVKTGITPNAGPCLCTSLMNEEFQIIVVIICTKSMDIRWPETWKLANWAMTRLKTIDKFKQLQNNNDPIQHKRLINRIRHL